MRHHPKHVSSDKHFYLNGGKSLSSVEDLAECIGNLSDEEFSHHVNSEKNDFANWIVDVFGDKNLSSELRLVSDKNKAKEILKRHLSQSTDDLTEKDRGVNMNGKFGMVNQPVSRRSFLQGVGVAAAGLALAGMARRGNATNAITGAAVAPGYPAGTVQCEWGAETYSTGIPTVPPQSFNPTTAKMIWESFFAPPTVYQLFPTVPAGTPITPGLKMYLKRMLHNSLMMNNFATLNPRGNGASITLQQTKRPSDFSSEIISATDGATYQVEFQMPGAVRRGWYIKAELDDETERKLVMYLPGRLNSIEGMNGPEIRKYLANLAFAGYDVLYLDLRGHGWSTGCCWDNENMAEDVFDVLDSLESGNFIAIDPSGGSSKPYLKANTPTVLFGLSQGTQVITRAMAKYKGNPAYSTYKIKGAACFDGFQGMRIGDMQLIIMGCWLANLNDSALTPGIPGLPPVVPVPAGTPSQIFVIQYADNLTLGQWPALLSVSGTGDVWAAAEGQVEAYNAARGRKQIWFLPGAHGCTHRPEFSPYATAKLLKFCADAFKKDWPLTNAETKTVQELVCQAAGKDLQAFSAVEGKLEAEYKQYTRDLETVVTSISIADYTETGQTE